MRVFVSGYYGFGNLGDEMLLDALKDLLIGFGFKEEDIWVLSSSPKDTLREHGLPSLNRMDLLRLSLMINKGDILISGPGGLFQDVTGRWSPVFYSSHVFLAYLKRAKVFLYGQSLGPIVRRLNLHLLKAVTSKAYLVALRDRSLSDLVPKDKLFFTPDPAFALEFPLNEVSEREGILFVFRKWPWDLDELLSVLVKLNIPLAIASFQPSLEREEGLRLSKRYGLPFYELSNWREALRLISSFRLLIGMRLHSLVISALSYTPFIGLSYDPKVKGLCDSLDMPYINGKEEIPLLDRYVDGLMVKWDRKSEELKERVELLRSEVRNVFKECMDILTRRE